MQAPAQAIQDTIARIVTDVRYQRNVTDTVLSRLWRWLSEIFSRIFDRVTSSGETQVAVLVVVGALVAAAIARAVIVARARRTAAETAARAPDATDLLAEADALAKDGAHARAVHRLLDAVIAALVDRRLVRAHPAMTTGDYARALRGTAIAPQFRSFARAWERAAYDGAIVTAERYAQLRTQAHAMITPSESLRAAA
jgi:hypothetical protein